MELDETLRRLEAARGDPSALALATLDIVLESRGSKFARAIDAAAVPHWFDEALLRALVTDAIPEEPNWFNELIGLTFVEGFQAHGGWNIHEVTRLALRKRLFTTDPEQFRALSKRAAALFDTNGPTRTIERLYHLLACDPAAAAVELRDVWTRWNRAGQLGALQGLAKILDELCATDILTPHSRACALVALGVIREDRMPLRQWEDMARQAIELMTPLDDPRGLIDAYRVLGRALRAQGRLGEAIAAYEQALRCIERWARNEADELEIAEEYANVHEGVGRALRDRGQLRDALREFEAAMETRRRLCELHPADQLRRRELAVAQTDVGDALLLTPRAAEAERYFHDALAVVDSSDSSGYGSDANDYDVAQLKIRLGDVLMNRGSLDAALREFEDAAALVDRLTKSDPDQLGWRSALAHVRIRLGNANLYRGDLDEAEREYMAARDIYRELAERDGTNPMWTQGLGDVSSTVGVLRESQARWADAAREYVEAERLLRELSGTDPDMVEWKISHVGALNMLGRLLQKTGEGLQDEQEKVKYLLSAVSQFVSARKTLTDLIERDNENTSWQGNLAWTERLLASATATVADFVEAGLSVEIELSATQLRERALDLYASGANRFRMLAEQEPQNTQHRRDFSLQAAHAAGLLEKLGKPREALTAYRVALTTSEELIAIDGANKSWANDAKFAREAIARLDVEDDISNVDKAP